MHDVLLYRLYSKATRSRKCKNKTTIIGNDLPNIPWEKRSKKCSDVVWRWSKNPVLDWNPIPKAARIYNSAVAPRKRCIRRSVSERTKKTDARHCFPEKVRDGLKWTIGPGSDSMGR